MEPNLEISNTIIPNPPQDDVEPKPKPVLTRKRNNGAMHVIRLALFMLGGRSKKQSVIPVDDKSTSIWRKLVGSIRPLHLQSNQSPGVAVSQSNSQKFDQAVILLPSSPPQSIGGGSVLIDFPAEEPFSSSPESPANSCYASAIGLNELVQTDENSRYASAIGLNELGQSDENSRYASAIGLNELAKSDENSHYASAIGLNELVQSDEDSRYASAIGLNELVQSDEDSRYVSAIGLNKLVQSDEENDKNDLIIEECNENGDDKIDAKADEFIAQFYQQMRLQRLNNADRRYQERSQRSLGL
jgi:hypothetical protein